MITAAPKLQEQHMQIDFKFACTSSFVIATTIKN
jgi:hypothetical protein